MRPERKARKFEATLYTVGLGAAKIGWWPQRSQVWKRGFVIRFWKFGLAVRWGRDKGSSAGPRYARPPRNAPQK